MKTPAAAAPGGKSASGSPGVAVGKDAAYDAWCRLILRPVITEKATLCQGHNQIVLRVALPATKRGVKEAVEGLFGVKVKSVNTLRQQGKRKRFRGIAGKRKDYKKALVTLEEGQSVDLSEGVRPGA